MRSKALSIVWILPLLLFGGISPCPAQEAAEDAPVAAAEAKPFREQTVYIPYKKLREVFEQQGRGVFLPYEQFQELWRKARAGEPKPVDDRPPVGAIVTEIANEATVAKDVISVQATLQIELLGKGWHEVPLRLKDAAIQSATIGDETARIIAHAEQGYKLLVKNQGDDPTPLTLALNYSKAYSKSPGQNSVAFEAPQAPVNRWRIRIPQAGVKVNVHPMIAATEAPAVDPADPDAEPPEETIVLAFVGAAPSVRVDWTPKAEGASGLEALATVQSQQQVSVDEGVVRTTTRLAYEISRAELSQLVLEVPADQKVTRVLDPNVRQWNFADDDDEEKQTIIVELFQPARGLQNLTIELEKFSDNEALQETNVPVVKALNVARQQGIVVVRLGEELRAEATTKDGLLQLDAGELPQALQAVPWAFAFRYAALPFELSLNVDKIEPRIRVQQLIEAYIEPEMISLDVASIFDIQRAGVFQIEMDLPEGFELVSVEGQPCNDAQPAVIDRRTLSGENNTHLQVHLARKAMGRVGLVVRLRQAIDDANLLTPTGESSDLAIPLPKITTEIEDITGRLVVLGPESLQITAQPLTGLRNVSLAEARQLVHSVRGNRLPSLRDVLGFVYTRDATALTLAAERRRPHVTARQLLAARIESGVVNYQATFYYDILYSAVKSLRIDVPQDLAASISVLTAGISKRTMNPQPDDVADGYVAWSVTGNSEFLGSQTFVFEWNQNTQELDVGKSADYELPALRPLDVDRAWGQIVVSKTETLDVQPAAGFVNLRPIDPQHDLMSGVTVEDAARAFEFQDDWDLVITATRYELEEPKRTSIERALVRMVVTRSEEISVQAVYRIRSALQRLAIELPEHSSFDMDMLYINGAPRTLERGDGRQLFIPLVNQSPDTPFVVEMRYTVPGGHKSLELPVFPAQEGVQSEPAVQKVELSVYLPDELSLIDAKGKWTNEQGNWYTHLNRLKETTTNDTDRIGWVAQGVSMNQQHARSFAIDGRLYRFTTLRPLPAPDGSLSLVAYDSRLVNVLVFGCVALLGVIGLGGTARWKLGLLAVLLLLLVLVGVFVPIVAMQILDQYLAIAIGLLIVAWIVTAAVRYKPQPRASTPEVEAESTEDEGTSEAAEEASEESGGDSPFWPVSDTQQSEDASDDDEREEGQDDA